MRGMRAAVGPEHGHMMLASEPCPRMQAFKTCPSEFWLVRKIVGQETLVSGLLPQEELSHRPWPKQLQEEKKECGHAPA